jgi:AcrR family transcriptional regulator
MSSTGRYGTARRAVKSTWPSQQAPGRAQRSDARRTRGRLLQAAGELLAAEAPFTLADVAAAAGVSTATAYRHFESADHVAFAFVAGFLDDVEERTVAAALPDEPAARMYELCRIWVETVLDWGPALAHLRSPEGFLTRRARREPEVTRSLRHLEPALRALLPAGASSTDLAYAVAVWNALADPREVLEQRTVLRWSARRIADHLHRAVLAVTSSPAAP